MSESLDDTHSGDSFRYFDSFWRMVTSLTSTQTALITHERDAGRNLGLAVNIYPFYHT